MPIYIKKILRLFDLDTKKMLSSILKYRLHNEYKHYPVLLSSFYRHESDDTFNFQQTYQDIQDSDYLHRIGFKSTLTQLIEKIESDPLRFRANLVDRFLFTRRQIVILDMRKAGHIVRTGPHPFLGTPLAHGDGSIGHVDCDDFSTTKLELDLIEAQQFIIKAFRALKDAIYY